MSTNYNGSKVVCTSESSVGDTFGKITPTSEVFPPVSETLKNFVVLPYVRLERIEIAPLNENTIANSPSSIGKIRGKALDVHMKKLAKKCTVNIQRDDLEKLRSNFKLPTSPSHCLHCDSDDMKCKICDKVYNSEKKLLNHQQNKHIIYKTDKKPQKRVSFSAHVIVHEVTEYHKCRKCPKIFEDYNTLRTHSKNEHKKRKCYICNYCQKKFVDRMFFKVHIRLHCDVCGKLYPNKRKYVKHRQIECRVLKLHKCKTCDEKFFRIMDLKDHSYEHNNLLYVCDICKDPFQSKCEIAHHIAFLHSKRRPKELYSTLKVGTERLYLCNFCEQSSVERDVIENHAQNLPDLMNKATTGYKDYYFCDHCMKKYDTEKDMLQHKWTHFLKTESVLKSILTKRPNVKTTYHIDEEIPKSMQPVLRLEKIDCSKFNVDKSFNLDEPLDVDESSNIDEQFNVNKLDINAIYTNGDLNDALQTVDVNTLKKKALVDPRSKKTIISKYQCQTCGKYYSSNSTLKRHIATQHNDFENLQCKVCEETFVWPSLLQSHKCIRLKHPEMPFDDARPEIHFDDSQFDSLNIEASEDYMNTVDFEIPAPIVELRECDSTMTNLPENFVEDEGVNSGYRLIMQEVPIEF